MMTVDATYLASVALSGRVLGALFYYAPDSPQLLPLRAQLKVNGWIAGWPLTHESLPALERMLAQGQDDALFSAWQRLFIGPESLAAPPWGSVWLDKESVLFGDSLLVLRQWLRRHAISNELRPGEPEDHIGALLLLAAWLAETGQHDRLDELLAWHLFPWAERYLQTFIAAADHPFWSGLGQLACLTLSGWRQGMRLPVAQKTVWFSRALA